MRPASIRSVRQSARYGCINERDFQRRMGEVLSEAPYARSEAEEAALERWHERLCEQRARDAAAAVRATAEARFIGYDLQARRLAQRWTVYQSRWTGALAQAWIALRQARLHRLYFLDGGDWRERDPMHCDPEVDAPLSQCITRLR